MPRQLPGLGSGAVRKRARSRKRSPVATAGSRRIGARWSRPAGRAGLPKVLSPCATLSRANTPATTGVPKSYP
jgi:hypothetical protein